MVLKKITFLVFVLFFFGCKSPTKECVDCAKEIKETGRTLYVNQCASCHGENGKLGNSGAKDLSKSVLSVDEIREILTEGKGAMPPALELVAEPKQMDSVIIFIQTLRTK